MQLPQLAKTGVFYENHWRTGLSDGEIHAGYEFEDGMFSRVRSWVDVAPWIRLVRVLRVLASPVHVGTVTLAWALTLAAFSVVSGKYPDPRLGFESLMFQMTRGFLMGAIYEQLLLIAFLLLLWIPVIQVVCRGGACLTSGKNLPSARVSLNLARSRLWKSYLVSIIPVLCILTFLIAAFLIRVPSLLMDSSIVSIISGLIIGVVSIPIGILWFGAFFAIPLGIVAMVCERDPDAFDSLSRGYEFLFRRPLSVIWYAAVSMVLVYFAATLLGGVGWTSSLAVTTIISPVYPDQSQFQAAHGVIGLIVICWPMTLAFGLLGGVYLLLRRDACGQDVEDLWEPTGTPREPVPSLPKEAYES